MESNKVVKEEVQVKDQEQPKPAKQAAKTVGNDYNIPTENNDNTNLFSGVTLIGQGQGGTNLAILLEKSLRKVSSYSKLLVINTALSDLSIVNLPKERKFLLGDASGMGKNREEGKRVFWGEDGKSDEIFNKFVSENNQLFFGTNQLVIVCFSLGGGSGSSIGPKFVAKLTKYCATVDEKYVTVVDGKKVSVPIEPYRPNVIGIALCPDYQNEMDNGIDTMQNSLEALKEIDVLVQNKIASFMLVQNKVERTGNVNENIFELTNQKVVRAFTKFIKNIGKSNSDTILDVRDRFNSLSIPGLMCFSTLENLEEYNMIPPAIGSTISRLAGELSYSNLEEKELKYDKYFDFVSQFNIADNILGWNDVNISNLDNNDDILLLSGYSNLSSIIVPLRETLDRKLKSLENKDLQGKSFNNIDKLKSDRVNSMSKNIDVDINNLI